MGKLRKDFENFNRGEFWKFFRRGIWDRFFALKGGYISFKNDLIEGEKSTQEKGEIPYNSLRLPTYKNESLGYLFIRRLDLGGAIVN